jgi:hypothetical protein
MFFKIFELNGRMLTGSGKYLPEFLVILNYELKFNGSGKYVFV